jgi:serine/threonine protein kinase/tetratricopeptide (TPR) repeat protein
MLKPLDPKALFQDAQERPPGDRAAFLDAACGGDPALRARVDALLAADELAGTFLSSPTGGAVETSAPQERAGDMVGHFKLRQQIGEGGFGIVWMAEQQEPVRRQVALKIVKRGMDTRSVVARFEQERQALAMMDHPNIAKVFDGGETPAGRPYFALELVRGVPITEYCDQQHLDSKERLSLFMLVCHAVQHAHQKGIIHRDIKPSNVLVTLHDGVPVPKVIDFGIAKAVHQPLTEKTLFTGYQQILGTPEYMSPEQAELSGLDLDTRADIYSLGVLLYELLTGTLPFDLQTLAQKGLMEVLRVIREDEPPKPSTRVSTLGETGAAVGKHRRTDTRRLGKLLRGDLDWIVMMALEKDRARRYVSADAFAADVQRHLRDEPVLASPPGRAYRLRKYVRRHRVGVTAGAAVATALLAGLSAAVWGYVEARVERDNAFAATDKAKAQAEVAIKAKAMAEEERSKAAAAHLRAEEARAEEARQRWVAKEHEAEAIKQAAEARTQAAEARQQAAIAGAVAKFQTDMLAAADPERLLGDQVTVLQAIEAAVRELGEGSLDGQPLVEAGVRDTIGTTLHSLARHDDAEPHLRRSLAIRRTTLPAVDPGIAVSLGNLASLLRDQNKFAEAEPLLREALAICRKSHPAGHLGTASALNNLAVFLHVQNKQLAEAELLVREALEIFREAYPDGHQDIAKTLDNLAKLLAAQNRLAQAEPLQREALLIRRTVHPPGHPGIATAQINLAFLLNAQNELAEAELLIREALVINRAAFPTGHPAIACALNNLADLLRVQNRLSEAEPLILEALDILRGAFPPRHPKIATGLNNLAMLLRDQHKFAEAEQLHREALEIDRGALVAGHPDIAGDLNNLAELLRVQRRLTEAEPLYREALDIWRAARPVGHPEIAMALNNLALLLEDQNELAEAERHFREALEIWRAAHPDGHPGVATTLNNLASLLQAQNELAEAEMLLREALEVWRATCPAGHPDIAVGLSSLAQFLWNQNKRDEAEPLYREALVIRRAARPVTHPDIAISLNSLARLLQDQNKLTEAEPLFREALEIRRSTLASGHPDIAISLNNLGLLLQDQNKQEEAEPLYREALEIFRAASSVVHPDFALTLNNLASLLLVQNELAEAEQLYREALESSRAACPAGHLDIAPFLNNLASFLHAQNKSVEAEPLFCEALEILCAAGPLEHPHLRGVRVQLADLYAKQGNADKAVPLLKVVFETDRALLRKDSPELAMHLAAMSKMLLDLKAWDECEPLLRECLAIREKAEPDAWTTFNAMSMLGGALLGQKKLADAEPLLLEGYRGMKEREAVIPLVGATRIPEALERLVQLHEATGNTTEAAAWRSKRESARATLDEARKGGGQ